jgi:hypothetical protein
MFETILNNAILLGAVILGFFLRNYFGSYVSEKGKNLATKEDVTQITQQIESVKASIHTLTQIKTDYEQQRRQWLLFFYDSAVDMHYEKFGVNFGDLPSDGGKSLFEFQQSFNSTVSAMVKGYQRVIIYFPHEHELRVCTERVLNLAIKAHKIFKQNFGRIKTSSIEEQAAIKSGESGHMHDAAKNFDEENKVYWDALRPVIDEFREALGRYLTSLNHFMVPETENAKHNTP